MPEMTPYERAAQVYQALICAAHNRQIVTYPMLGEAVGLPARALASPLGHIRVYCEENDPPPLTGLVVKTGEGQLGSGFDSPEDLDRARESVFDYDWFRMRSITPDQLKRGA